MFYRDYAKLRFKRSTSSDPVSYFSLLHLPADLLPPSSSFVPFVSPDLLPFPREGPAGPPDAVAASNVTLFTMCGWGSSRREREAKQADLDRETEEKDAKEMVAWSKLDGQTRWLLSHQAHLPSSSSSSAVLSFSSTTSPPRPTATSTETTWNKSC
eukprot:g72289.t1